MYREIRSATIFKINTLAYKLYGLNDNEKKIVEDSERDFSENKGSTFFQI